MITGLMDYFFYFLICSFLGWIVESTFKSIEEKRPVNSGFLHGPFVPVYGFGALAVHVLGIACAACPRFLALTMIALVPSAVEYLASFLLEKIFSVKLWDYRDLSFNLNGRIWLWGGICWAFLSIGTFFTLEPAALAWIRGWGDHARWFIAGMGVMYLAADIWISGRVYFAFVAALKKIREAVASHAYPLPIIGMTGQRIPVELKRFLKPLKSFPLLRREIMSNLQVFPEQVLELVKRTLGAKPRSRSRPRRGREDDPETKS
ncbi:MAG: putative ABC transporter permease [Spirochaetes bacterium]|nr:putative ABC transporter permease [Spirochaetota bacterium]